MYGLTLSTIGSFEDFEGHGSTDLMLVVRRAVAELIALEDIVARIQIELLKALVTRLHTVVGEALLPVWTNGRLLRVAAWQTMFAPRHLGSFKSFAYLTFKLILSS